MSLLKEFKIDHLDALGQGVSKLDESVIFIPKTLPDERGLAKIRQSKKGVHFAQLETLKTSSPNRVTPGCPHYGECTGCHYLHSDYEQELVFKEQNFRRIFRKYLNSRISITGAKDRLGYRNRLQLHYDVKEKKLGFVNQLTHQIIEVPKCLIGTGPIKEKLAELYHNFEWLHLVKNQKNKGHLELYQKGDGVSVTVNEDYADGGFTQVNRQMNEILVETVTNSLKNYHDFSKPLLDLFAGNGNLTKQIASNTAVSCVDFYTQGPGKNKLQDHFHLDLYHPQALKSFQGHSHYTTLVLDPPRRGFKNIKDWSDKYKFNFILYVSCNPMTLIRDIESIDKEYTVTHLSLLDLFPSTYHFETIAILIRKL